MKDNEPSPKENTDLTELHIRLLLHCTYLLLHTHGLLDDMQISKNQIHPMAFYANAVLLLRTWLTSPAGSFGASAGAAAATGAVDARKF